MTHARHTHLRSGPRAGGERAGPAERGEEGIERVRELTGCDGTHTVLECVGLEQAVDTALGDVPDGYRAMADREALRVLVRP